MKDAYDVVLLMSIAFLIGSVGVAVMLYAVKDFRRRPKP